MVTLPQRNPRLIGRATQRGALARHSSRASRVAPAVQPLPPRSTVSSCHPDACTSCGRGKRLGLTFNPLPRTRRKINGAGRHGVVDEPGRIEQVGFRPLRGVRTLPSHRIHRPRHGRGGVPHPPHPHPPPPPPPPPTPHDNVLLTTEPEVAVRTDHLLIAPSSRERDAMVRIPGT